jgi:hypothetical protein
MVTFLRDLPHDFSRRTGEIAVQKIVSLAGWNNWRKCQEQLDARRKNSFMARSIEELYYVELVIPSLYKNLMLTGRLKSGQLTLQENSSVRFAFYFCWLHERLSQKGKRRLEGSLRDALKREHGLGPLRWELTVLTSLLGDGCMVVAADLEDEERFDFLVSVEDLQFAVECKFLTSDHIARVAHRNWSRFGKEMENKYLDHILVPGKSVIVTVSLPDKVRFPSREGDVKGLAAAAARGIAGNLETVTEGDMTLSFQPWPSGINEPFSIHQEAVRITNTSGKPTIAFHRPSSAVIFVLDPRGVSLGDFKKHFSRPIRAAIEQLPDDRPGIIFLELEGIDSREGDREKDMAKALVKMALDSLRTPRPLLDRLVGGFAGYPFYGGTGFVLVNPDRCHEGIDIIDRLFARHKNYGSIEEDLKDWREAWRSRWPNR